MKKVKHVSFKENPNTETLKQVTPLYLLSTENPKSSIQVDIFISRCEKNCYIREKGSWQKLIIEDFLLSPKSKTYCFPVKNVYRYLDIPYQDQSYLTLAKNSKHKVVLKNIELSEEILQELAFPNLERLDTSAMAKTKLKAEKILQLKIQNAEIKNRINNLEKRVHVFTESRAAMEKIDSGNKEAFTLEDIDAQIKLFKRQKHYYEFLVLKNQIKIQALLIKETNLNSECYERDMLRLRLQNKEISRDIQNIILAVAKLKQVIACFKNSNTALDDPLIKEHVNRQIQLLEKRKLNHEIERHSVEEKIKNLNGHEISHNDFLGSSLAKQLFFNGNMEKNIPKKVAETELKNLNL
ncbi:MAG: hypothetical protein WAL30_06880 [Candidatus Aquirickettsiella sp.]